jgi:uncharacterized FAD-dependent dehydrogenase
MAKNFRLRLSVQEWSDSAMYRAAVARLAGLSTDTDFVFKELRRTIDARSRNIKIETEVTVFDDGEEMPASLRALPDIFIPKSLEKTAPVLITGAGPAGLFAALRLLAMGIKPIIIERGKAVRDRRRDLVKITREGLVNADSNYCFGEGGAGTYSDGKLYTRSTKRGDVRAILEALVYFGAPEDILIDAHPHIGTNKLPAVIEAMRKHLLLHGAEIYFNCKLTDIEAGKQSISAHTRDTENGETRSFSGKALLLCTGHSARDIFELLNSKGWAVEAKLFALGVRIEHPQEVIDTMQYHCSGDELSALRKILPAASYSLVSQSGGRGTYSLCMCPGGIIAPCATAPGELVTNGWSPSKRNNRFANSGMVVEVRPEDWEGYSNDAPALAALRYQQHVERKAFEAGGKNLFAPAQRLGDFLKKKDSASLPDCSYNPGIVSADLFQVLPENISNILRSGLEEIIRRRPGYGHKDAVLVATESRTSSPVRIPRDPAGLNHPDVPNLFPCGEGGGYAGGIVSAAIDGVNVASVIK